MRQKTFVVLHHDPVLLQVLFHAAGPAASELLGVYQPDPHGSKWLVAECSQIEDTTFGFLRLHLKAAASQLPVVAVPLGSVVALLEAGSGARPGFLSTPVQP